MEHFCHNPFLGLDISADGMIKPCCKFLSSETPKFQIQNGIDSYKNSKWLKNIQNQFLAGGRPKGCDRCWKEESAGIKSKRQMDFQRHKKEFETYDLSSTKFININLTFGNLCNLACRICGPGPSSKWASEQKKIDGKKYPIHKWHTNKETLKEIYNETKDAIRIDVSGGEPLLVEIKEHFEYLKKFVDDGQSSQISLHYISNGTTLLSESHISIWKKFKEVDITLSIDGIEKQFNYNRWPANWNEVYDNLKNYQKICKNSKNIKISIAHTISVFTILYAEKFFIWCIRQGLPAPWLGLVSTPKHYDPSVLPAEVRKQISSILDHSKIKEVRKLKDYLQYDNSQYFNKFLSITRQLDTMRNQNFQKTFPELAEMIRHYI